MQLYLFSFSLEYYLTHYYLSSVSTGYTNITIKIHISILSSYYSLDIYFPGIITVDLTFSTKFGRITRVFCDVPCTSGISWVPSAFLIWKKYAHVPAWEHESAYWLPLNIKYCTHIINILHLHLGKLGHSRNMVEIERKHLAQVHMCKLRHSQILWWRGTDNWCLAQVCKLGHSKKYGRDRQKHLAQVCVCKLGHNQIYGRERHQLPEFPCANWGIAKYMAERDRMCLAWVCMCKLGHN